MEHYICTGGCEGVSEKAGMCRADGCPKHGKPLEPCNCEDGKHYGAFASEENPEDLEEEEL